MGFIYYMILWVVLSGLIMFLAARYFYPNKNVKKNSTKPNKITGYGGPEIELPPGIVLEEDDNDYHSENIKSSK
jgi:hypothetical protein